MLNRNNFEKRDKKRLGYHILVKHYSKGICLSITRHSEIRIHENCCLGRKIHLVGSHRKLVSFFRLRLNEIRVPFERVRRSQSSKRSAIWS